MSEHYTICSHCSVNNEPGRANCWSCNKPLPIAFGLDGLPTAVVSKSKTLSPEELNALLNSATTVDVESDTKRFRDEQKVVAQAAIGETATVEPSLASESPFKDWVLRWRKRHSPQA